MQLMCYYQDSCHCNIALVYRLMVGYFYHYLLCNCINDNNHFISNEISIPTGNFNLRATVSINNVTIRVCVYGKYNVIIYCRTSVVVCSKMHTYICIL